MSLYYWKIISFFIILLKGQKNSFMGIIIFLLIAIGGWMLIPSFFWAIVFEIIGIAAGFFIISKKNG